MKKNDEEKRDRKRKDKRQRIREKRSKIFNRKLCKKYPWLKPWHTWKKNKYGNWQEHYGWQASEKYSYIMWYGWPRGWNMSFADMMLKEIGDVVKREKLQIHVCEMKEKWGRMVLDISGYNDEIESIIDKYEVLSQNICAFCGKPDVPMINAGYVLPLCYECFKRHIDRSKQNDDVLMERYKNFMCSDSKMDDYVVKKDSHGQLVNEQYIKDTADKIRKRWKK